MRSFYFSKQLPDTRNEETMESASKASRSLIVMTVLILGMVGLGLKVPYFQNETHEMYLLVAVMLIIIGSLYFLTPVQKRVLKDGAPCNTHNWY